MDSNRQLQKGYYGRLPSPAPLANPYVPFQTEDSPKYEPKTAIMRGTLFPGLDLPFMNMVNQKELPMTPMAELQTLSFMLQELALYLDTHADDREAFEVYQTFQELYAKGREKYEMECGPLTHMSKMKNGYSWINDPWPWEYAGNKEG